MRNTIVVLLSLAVVLVGMYAILSHDCLNHACFSFRDKRLWKLVETYEQNQISWRGYFSHPEYTIRLERISNVSQKQADEFNKIRVMKLLGLFDNARSPYPGEISDEVVCGDANKPQQQRILTKTNLPIDLVAGYLNNRLQYGTCERDQAVYQGFVSMFYCSKSRQWYQFELIYPIQQKAKSIDTIASELALIACE